ncbi:hypothetical protein DSO57_1008144 [Entomophthora muscae]|uniref:Uncharacterized protein n=1 Tax=Entomophthora muscae TaxID=34485 RepID=A0ACC2SK27_9FUNG|nr:hypothetical protein DSO57_1008144 [Entomophthora muscae]
MTILTVLDIQAIRPKQSPRPPANPTTSPTTRKPCMSPHLAPSSPSPPPAPPSPSWTFTTTSPATASTPACHNKPYHLLLALRDILANEIASIHPTFNFIEANNLNPNRYPLSRTNQSLKMDS